MVIMIHQKRSQKILTVLLLLVAIPQALSMPLLNIEAEQIESRVIETPERHKIFIGRLKKIANTLSPEDALTVVGQYSAQTYRVQPDINLDEVIEALADNVQKNLTPIYQCRGRGCGSSNEWANAVFGVPELYGPEETQYYWVGQSKSREDYVLIYASQRSNKPVFLQIDRIQGAGGGVITELLENLEAQGVVRLALAQVQGNPSAFAEAISRWCKGRDGAVLALVVSDQGSGSETSDLGLSETSRLAGDILDRIDDYVTDVSESTTQGHCIKQSYGFGALAPVVGAPNPRIDLVLLP